jgi:secondary thiamine-phosphate synthase enzyme
MTSIEVPYSIAAVLPTLTVMDITNDVSREIKLCGCSDGIAFITSGSSPSLVRINERECGFFEDLECLLEQLIPLDGEQRERMVQMLLGPRTEQVPIKDGALCLGTWQRVLLVAFNGHRERDWVLTVVG